MSTTFAAPPRWTAGQLDEAVDAAMESFRRERGEEPVDQYRDYLDQYVCTVHDLIELTVDLLQLHERAGDVVTEAPLLEALRFCAGPFISEDDLAVLARTTLSRTRLRKDPDAVARIVDTVLLELDTLHSSGMRR